MTRGAPAPPPGHESSRPHTAPPAAIPPVGLADSAPGCALMRRHATHGKPPTAAMCRHPDLPRAGRPRPLTGPRRRPQPSSLRAHRCSPVGSAQRNLPQPIGLRAIHLPDMHPQRATVSVHLHSRPAGPAQQRISRVEGAAIRVGHRRLDPCHEGGALPASRARFPRHRGHSCTQW